VNGCGIARDAAGRGLSVLLCEQNDLASGTSSASTKLVHGGLRYLEHYEFRLVRESLMEREVLLRSAPHIIWPLRFVLPHHKGLRPRWMLRLGLFLYDHLGGRRLLPPTRSVDFRRDPVGGALQPTYRYGFEYSDCWVDDARLVVLAARDAAERGATILPRTRCLSATREADGWRLVLADVRTGAETTVEAKVLVNAGGPWVGSVLRGVVRSNAPSRTRLVKGSHIIVPRVSSDDRAFIFQNSDGRIIFAIPYEGDFTLIGTTDEDFRDDPATVAISEPEIAYLCRSASEYLARPVKPEDIVWTYSGVRSLYDDGASAAQEATRDYVLDLDAGEGKAPLLSVFGGKITTFRRLAESALERLGPYLPSTGRPWTAEARLPGGDFAPDGAAALAAEIREAHPYLAPHHAARLVRAYGTRARRLLEGCRSAADLGRTFGADLTEREVDYLMQHEWARTGADVLWRRSKLGLRLTGPQREALDAWMGERAQTTAEGPVR